MRFSASTTPAARSSGPGSSAPASDDRSYGVSADGLGNVYISGYTEGSLEGTNAGESRCVYQQVRRQRHARVDPAARHQRVVTRAVAYRRMGWGMSTFRATPMAAWGGPTPATTMRLSASTTPAARSSGPSSSAPADVTTSHGVSADGLGNVYISGDTDGSLGGPNAGGADAFVAKFTDLLLGDVNFDGEVNGLDVDPFVDVLLNGTDDNATRQPT